MMWDFGGGNTYAPGDDARTTPQQSTYPPAQQPVAPFAPLVGPAAYSPAPDSTYANPPSTIRHSVSSSPAYPPSTLASSYPPTPFSGGFGPPQPQRDVVISVSQSHSSHRHGHHHSHSHSHSPARPHRASNATRPSSSRPHSAQIVQHPQHYLQPAPPPAWQYSRCTGRRKALCIGINYFGTPEKLQGCINDARDVHRFLIRHHNYRPEDMVLLTDDAQDPRQWPTRQNIRDAMRWLVKDAQQDDALFFHYSGHGAQVKDKDGDEVDGYDEVILPSDFRSAGVITDDEMHEIMVKPLPRGCRLTALFDSCHSGSALDLPYLYHTDGRVRGSQVNARARKAKESVADVISLSGCNDDQTSADVVQAGYASGAMSHTFISSLSQRPTQTYAELLKSVRGILRERYKQKPQLSSSHRIDTNLRFII